jgi:hypothetical protein
VLELLMTSAGRVPDHTLLGGAGIGLLDQA